MKTNHVFFFPRDFPYFWGMNIDEHPLNPSYFGVNRRVTLQNTTQMAKSMALWHEYVWKWVVYRIPPILRSFELRTWAAIGLLLSFPVTHWASALEPGYDLMQANCQHYAQDFWKFAVGHRLGMPNQAGVSCNLRSLSASVDDIEISSIQWINKHIYIYLYHSECHSLQQTMLQKSLSRF